MTNGDGARGNGEWPPCVPGALGQEGSGAAPRDSQGMGVLASSPGERGRWNSLGGFRLRDKGNVETETKNKIDIYIYKNFKLKNQSS